MKQRYPLFVLTCFMLAACGNGKMADLEQYVQQVKKREPAPIEPLPDVKPIDTFVYEAGERRDPFVMDAQTAEAASTGINSGIQAPEPRRKEELEQFSLDSLKMVGTLEQDDNTWGLVKGPGGTLYRVRVGNYMGMNNGQITRITEDEIELTEIVAEKPGDWRERQAAIALSQ
ncbi:MAG: pilus assembly protein PilP [Chromatiaceae bacterium]|jgi:type IV pilus assembly protein PilP